MQKRIACLVILIITIIYLFPFFLGKVDTPIDTRNVPMYPWRYYSVDKKVKKFVLWEYTPSSKKDAYSHKKVNRVPLSLKTPPNTRNNFLFDLTIDELLLIKLNKIKDLTYYLTFDFNTPNYESVVQKFQVSLHNKSLKQTIKLPVTIYQDSLANKNRPNYYFTAYVPLNEIQSIKDLNLYYLEFGVENFSKVKPAFFYLKNLKVVCEDFSRASTVHNPYISDLVQWYVPSREYFSKLIKQGKLPAWSNFNLTGNEFLSDSRIPFFHPFYFLTYFLFEHFTAHGIVTFVFLFLCGIGAFFLASYWGLSFAPALLTSIVYMFHPYNATHFSYENVLMNSAALAFLILAYEKHLKASKFINKYLLISATLLGSIFISGQIQVCFYTCVFFFFFTMFRFLLGMFSYKKDCLRHIFSILFVFSVGLMIGSIVFVPYFSLLRESFNITYREKTTPLVPIKIFATLIYPYYYGFPAWYHSGLSSMEPVLKEGFFRNYVYFGFLPFMFVLICFKELFRDKLIMFFSTIVIFSILIATGSPVFYLLRYFVPHFKELQHYRFLELYSYTVPFLAGIGFQILLSQLSFLSKKLKIILISIFVLISAIDLMYYSSYFVSWSQRSDYKFLHKTDVLKFLINKKKASREPFRVLPFVTYKVGETSLKLDIAKPNTLLPYGIEDVSGYSTLIPKDLYSAFVYIQTSASSQFYHQNVFQIFENYDLPYPIYNFNSKLLDILNVKYFIVPDQIVIESEKVKEIFKENCRVYENKRVMPRAFVVPFFKVNYFTSSALRELDSDQFDPYKYVILKSYPEIDLNALKAAKGNIQLDYNVDFLKYEQDKIELKVQVNRPAFLVLGNNLNNNWEVRINGEPHEHFVANVFQRALYLPDEGDYFVEFYYVPKLFLKGLLFTSLAIFVLIALGLFLRIKQKGKKDLDREEYYKELEQVDKAYEEATR